MDTATTVVVLSLIGMILAPLAQAVRRRSRRRQIEREKEERIAAAQKRIRDRAAVDLFWIPDPTLYRPDRLRARRNATPPTRTPAPADRRPVEHLGFDPSTFAGLPYSHQPTGGSPEHFHSGGGSFGGGGASSSWGGDSGSSDSGSSSAE